MPIYQIDGMTPVVPDESYVHPTAVLIGDVILGKGVRWPQCQPARRLWAHCGERRR
jgi:carbonic anhydrase/acetyltransferase-like protein (isoleucine patch superfamily)